jgi:hypothetical protein
MHATLREHVVKVLEHYELHSERKALQSKLAASDAEKAMRIDGTATG